MPRFRPRHLASVAGLLAAVLSSNLVAQKPEMDEPTLKGNMRKLWEDHVTWTRLYLVSAAGQLADKQATANRLLQNQTDIGNAIRPFYGDSAAGKLTRLLKGHIEIATELVDAAMKKEGAKKEDASKRWRANADEIAAMLSAANPTSWPVADLKPMMHSHLELTAKEVETYLAKDWAGSIEAYDRVHEQILVMADALTAGIAKQFPQKVAVKTN